jgi:mycobactin salicyl-AMP ligase
MSSTHLSQTRVNSSECRHLPPRSETISALDHMFNSCRFAVALFGLLRAGAIPVMCLPGHRLAELSHFADVSQAVALIITDTAGGFDYRAMADELVRTHPMRIITELPEAAELPSVEVDPGSPALLLVSGGTTGAPKLIPRTHDDYVYNVTASAELCGLTANDVYLVALPAAHNFPLACPGLLGAMSVGATTVFTTDPSPESAFATIARHGVTVTALVPALAKLWAQACEWEPQRPTTLRLLQVGGAKLGADDARTVRSVDAGSAAGVRHGRGSAELHATR